MIISVITHQSIVLLDGHLYLQRSSK